MKKYLLNSINYFMKKDSHLFRSRYYFHLIVFRGIRVGDATRMENKLTLQWTFVMLLIISPQICLQQPVRDINE